MAWTQIVALAANLLACFRHLALPVGELRDAAPKLLRYRLLHLPGRLTRGQRKRSPAPRRLALDHRPDQRLAGSHPCQHRHDQQRADPTTRKRPHRAVEPGATGATIEARTCTGTGSHDQEARTVIKETMPSPR